MPGGIDPEIPDGAIRLDLPSGKAKLLARVQMGADLDAAVALQHGFSVRSTGAPRIEATVPVAAFTNTEPPGAAMFAQPHARSGAGRAGPIRTRRTRSGRGSSGSRRSSPPIRRTREQLDKLVRSTCSPAFMQLLIDLAEVGHGWRSTGNRDGFGTDYRFRAVANFAGIWWNSASEVIYYALQADETGHPPTGDHHYAIRFAAGESPGEHVDGYWSMTLYSHPTCGGAQPDRRVLDQLPHRTHPRRRRGFTIHIAAEQPARRPDANWLPSTGPGEAWSSCSASTCRTRTSWTAAGARRR